MGRHTCIWWRASCESPHVSYTTHYGAQLGNAHTLTPTRRKFRNVLSTVDILTLSQLLSFDPLSSFVDVGKYRAFDWAPPDPY